MPSVPTRWRTVPLRRQPSRSTRATQLLPSGDERTEAALALVDALAHVGRVDDALAAARALVSDVRGDAGVTVHLSLARAAMTVTRWALAATELDRARSLLDDEAGAGLLAQVAVREAELAMGMGDATTAVAHARAGAHERGTGRRA